MSVTDDLKPCPFCGSEADVRLERNANVLNVGCVHCGIFTRCYIADKIGLAEAIAVWNRRAS